MCTILAFFARVRSEAVVSRPSPAPTFTKVQKWLNPYPVFMGNRDILYASERTLRLRGNFKW
jgi:hypothetical protein